MHGARRKEISGRLVEHVRRPREALRRCPGPSGPSRRRPRAAPRAAPRRRRARSGTRPSSPGTTQKSGAGGPHVRRHGRDEPVLADREADGRRRRPAELGDEVVVAPAARGSRSARRAAPRRPRRPSGCSSRGPARSPRSRKTGRRPRRGATLSSSWWRRDSSSRKSSVDGRVGQDPRDLRVLRVEEPQGVLVEPPPVLGPERRGLGAHVRPAAPARRPRAPRRSECS